MTEGPPPPVARMIVAVLSLVGFFVCFYLLAHHFGWTGPLVCGISDCETVQSSPYAKLGPIPVAGIGVAGYVALFVLSMVGSHPTHRDSKLLGGLLVAGAAVGVVFSAYLTYLEAAVIRAWCQWCIVSAILILLIFAATLPELKRIRSRGAP